ncbi:MAG: HAMP domain-containing protein [Hydrogenophilaceae bacterium]|jgi:signal transduction histidine kinase|nr:HAMP domain-containing protein [Hydrogenophilaceae bacterium]
MWNPLRTLSGRLILVTIAAIGLSHTLAFVLLVQERSAAMRRIVETSTAERIADLARQVRTDARPRSGALDVARGPNLEFTVAATPIVDSGAMGGIAGRVARAVSTQLDGAPVRARLRPLSPSEREAWIQRERALRRAFLKQGVPHGEGRALESPPPPYDRAEPRYAPRPPQQKENLLQVAVQMGPAAWLNVQTRIGAGRPLPRYVIYTAFGSILAMSIGAFFIARQIGRPLADLASAADRLGRGEREVLTPVRGPDDVRRASSAFNAMAERLRRQLARQRQMLWALSHDLRTPMTALRLRAELIDDSAARERLLAPLAEMEALAEQALSLARAGASDETPQSIDIADMARTLAAELRELGLKVDADAAQPVIASCRPNEIARAMRNLAENAARHGGGGILRVRSEPGGAVIEALDEGPGVPEALRERLTQPFFRADAARGGGTGLGLAIAQAIAEGHGGRLTIENRTPRGLAVRIHLPALSGG